MAKKQRCNSCELARINGLLCHETGCPDAWTTETRECKWCGQEFQPEQPRQDCCDDSCNAAYHGYDAEPFTLDTEEEE